MKRLTKFLIMALCAFAFLPAEAQSIGNPGTGGSPGGNSDTSDLKEIILFPTPTPTPPKRPNAPARYFIECAYTDGYMEFIFPESVSFLFVQISQDGFEWTFSATVDNPIIELPYFSGEYTIICTDNLDRQFYGEIFF